MYSDYAVFSNFTLAFFEDSGWYKVNYTFINNYDQFELQWGKGVYYWHFCGLINKYVVNVLEKVIHVKICFC